MVYGSGDSDLQLKIELSIWDWERKVQIGIPGFAMLESWEITTKEIFHCCFKNNSYSAMALGGVLERYMLRIIGV